MEKILSGVQRFRTITFPELREMYEGLAEKQIPDALFITCGDSRIDPSLLTGTHPGELFVERINALEQLKHLHTHPVVEQRFKAGSLGLHGWMYEIHTGIVKAYSPATGEFELV